MNNSPSASSINSGASSTFPQKLSLLVSLEFDIQDQDQLQYLTDGAGNLQLGLIADLYDMFNFQSDMGVTSINGVTHEQVLKHFQKLL